MAKFIDLEVNSGLEGALNTLEVPAMLAVLERVLSGLEQKTQCSFPYGTLILDSQKYGEPAENIWRCHLEEGKYDRPLAREKDSDCLAEASIDEVLSWPETSRYVYFFDGPTPASGIYWQDDLRVLILNTDQGRFLFTACLNYSAHSQLLADQTATALLYACARTLMRLRPHDETLWEDPRQLAVRGGANQYACARGKQKLSAPLKKYAITTVNRLFDNHHRTLPALQRLYDKT